MAWQGAPGGLARVRSGRAAGRAHRRQLLRQRRVRARRARGLRARGRRGRRELHLALTRLPPPAPCGLRLQQGGVAAPATLNLDPNHKPYPHMLAPRAPQPTRADSQPDATAASHSRACRRPPHASASAAAAGRHRCPPPRPRGPLEQAASPRAAWRLHCIQKGRQDCAATTQDGWPPCTVVALAGLRLRAA